MRDQVLYVIFLELNKAYGALDRDRCLETLEGYGMGPQARCILQIYWDCLRIVAQAGGYYRAAFQGLGGGGG